MPLQRPHPDTIALDWLETFGGSIDRDPATGRWTVRPAPEDYPPAGGPTLRSAARAAIRRSQHVDATTAMEGCAR